MKKNILVLMELEAKLIKVRLMAKCFLNLVWLLGDISLI